MLNYIMIRLVMRGIKILEVFLRGGCGTKEERQRPIIVSIISSVRERERDYVHTAVITAQIEFIRVCIYVHVYVYVYVQY